MAYVKIVTPCKAITSAAGTALTDAINIEMFDKFAILYQNDNSLINFLELYPTIGIDGADTTASDSAPDLVVANSGIIPSPSALANTAAILTSAIDNVYRWIKFHGHTCQTAIAGSVTITIAGHRRY